GLNLFATHALFGIPLGKLYRGVQPFIVIYLIALALITYVPAITLAPLKLWRWSLLTPPLPHILRERLLPPHPDPRPGGGEAELLPALHHGVVGRLGELRATGEALDEAVVHAGVDQRLRSPRPDLRWVEAGVEIGAPGLAQNVDRLRRPRARRHRPQH